MSRNSELIAQFKVRTRFNYDRDAVSIATAPPQPDDGKTQQNFKEECDINTIVQRFNLTGQLPENLKLPQYVNYEGVFDFQTAMQTMMEAEEQFMSVPAHIRAQFDNSPQKFLEYCENPNNREGLRKLGLLKPEPPQPAPAPPTAPPTAPPGPAST